MFRRLFQKRLRKREIEEEFEAHLASNRELLEECGLSREKAELHARRLFGDRSRLAEETRVFAGLSPAVPFRFMRILLALAALLVAAVAVDAKDYFLFAYFEEPAKSGVYYALSTDGYHWTPLNSARPIFAPEYPGELMRDIFITRGPDGEFHAVWTWGWRERRIGYAHSADLVHWSPQQQIPLMEKVPGTVHTWAPEIYWDKASARWLILWSSITAEESRNRIFYSFTRDFRDFTPPAVFFDPGYDVIDATILRDRSRYVLVFKDQTKNPLRFQLRLANGPALLGPWSDISDPFTESWSEGPSALKIGRYYFIYYDHYRATPQHETKRYEAVRSTDLKHWESINDEISFPKGSKHGSFLRLTRNEAERLQKIEITPP